MPEPPESKSKLTRLVGGGSGLTGRHSHTGQALTADGETEIASAGSCGVRPNKSPATHKGNPLPYSDVKG